MKARSSGRPTTPPAPGSSQLSEARVELRPATPADAPLLAAWRTEPSVRRFQPLSQVPLAQMRAELAHQRSGDLDRGCGDKFQWIVVADGRPAGWITVVVSNWEHGLAEIGYALSSAYQRQGLMARAIHLLLADLFLRTGIERIEARCAVGNKPSQKILERLGFRREGRLRGYFILNGERVDNYLYAILRKDFF